jgi:hypothetical protein
VFLKMVALQDRFTAYTLDAVGLLEPAAIGPEMLL